MIEDKLLLAHNLFSIKGAHALLLGSGISRAAGIPSAWEILTELINRLAVLKGEPIPANAEKWYTENYSTAPGYSKIIEELTMTSEERVNLLKPFFEASAEEIEDGLKQPTIAHRNIARLVQKGYIKVIVTTNFDRLMENALREIGIEASIISNPSHIENVMPLIHSPITIIKIHGDYLDTKFLNIESELTIYNKELTEYMRTIFENFGLITCGWSGTWDFALRELLASSNKFRFTNYFTYVNQCEETLKQLAVQRHATQLPITDADNFFKELFENIEALESGMKASPLSKPIGVARLKKYISKEDHIIQLFELVNEAVENNYHFLQQQGSPKPDEENLKNAIDLRSAKLDLITALVTQGIYWGKNKHHEIWTNVISKFLHPFKNNSSWALWSSLSYLEGLLLFYVSGLAALRRRDFELLKQIFAVQVNNPWRDGERVNIMTRLFDSEIISTQNLNAIYGTRYIVPLNELVYKYAKPYFTQWMVYEDEFDDLFDSYELLISLFYIKYFGNGWFPKGRYIHRRRSHSNIIYTKKSELDTLKDKLDWIKDGLFVSYNDLIGYYTHFEEEMKKTPYH